MSIWVRGAVLRVLSKVNRRRARDAVTKIEGASRTAPCLGIKRIEGSASRRHYAPSSRGWDAVGVRERHVGLELKSTVRIRVNTRDNAHRTNTISGPSPDDYGLRMVRSTIRPIRKIRSTIEVAILPSATGNRGARQAPTVVRVAVSRRAQFKVASLNSKIDISLV